MSSGRKITLRRADEIAGDLVQRIGPYCVRIEVAGSVRRREGMVGDLDLVVIPEHVGGGLFGDALQSRLDTGLVELGEAGYLYRMSGGAAMRTYLVNGVAEQPQLNVFIVTPETWGVQLAIRTGPAEFSRSLVTEQVVGGRLRNGLTVREGRVWKGVGLEAEGCEPGEDDVRWADAAEDEFGNPMAGFVAALDTSTEEAFLELAGGWVDPHLRSAALAARHGRRAKC